MVVDLVQYRRQRQAAVPQSVELHYSPLPKHHLFTAKEFPGMSRANIDLATALEDFLSALTVRVRQQYGVAATYGTDEERDILLEFINWRKECLGPVSPQIIEISYLMRIVQ